MTHKASVKENTLYAVPDYCRHIALTRNERMSIGNS
jgi:hypothetical protein